MVHLFCIKYIFTSCHTVQKQSLVSLEYKWPGICWNTPGIKFDTISLARMKCTFNWLLAPFLTEQEQRQAVHDSFASLWYSILGESGIAAVAFEARQLCKENPLPLSLLLGIVSSSRAWEAFVLLCCCWFWLFWLRCDEMWQGTLKCLVDVSKIRRDIIYAFISIIQISASQCLEWVLSGFYRVFYILLTTNMPATSPHNNRILKTANFSLLPELNESTHVRNHTFHSWDCSCIAFLLNIWWKQ